MKALCWVQCQSSMGGKGCRPGLRSSRRPRHGEQGIADRLGVEPASRVPPEHPVFRVLGGAVGVVVARQPVGPRDEDLAMDRLDGPSSVDESRGEPVEEFGVSRGFASRRRSWTASPRSRVPKWYCQIRLTMTRAVSGWPGRVSHRASSSRPLVPGARDSGGSASRKANSGTPVGDDRPGVPRLAPSLERDVDRLPFHNGVRGRQPRRDGCPLRGGSSSAFRRRVSCRRASSSLDDSIERMDCSRVHRVVADSPSSRARWLSGGLDALGRSPCAGNPSTGISSEPA